MGAPLAVTGFAVAVLGGLGSSIAAVAAVGATYLLTQLTMAVCSTLVVLGLCLLMGYAGQISLTFTSLPHFGGPALRDSLSTGQTGTG